MTDAAQWLPTDVELAAAIDDYGIPIRVSVGHLPAHIAGFVEPRTGRVARDVANLLRRTADGIDDAVDRGLDGDAGPDA